MNFFEVQQQIESLTKKLYFLFILVVILISFLTSYGISFLYNVYFSISQKSEFDFITSYSESLASPLLKKIFFFIFFSLLFISWWKRNYLSRTGGVAVAESLGGVQVSPFSTEPQHRTLVNIAEEMSISSGVPLPAIFILENETSINAFAAGNDYHDSAIAVTRGAITQLKRDELQAVIAHEYGHIKYGDMKLNMNLISYLHGLNAISILGRTIWRLNNRSRDRGFTLLIGGVFFIFGSLGVFMGSILKAIISRNREFSADASAVQFTRQTEPLIQVLRKIFAQNNEYFNHQHTANISHSLFHYNSFLMFDLFKTHPPVTDRIKVLRGHQAKEEKNELSMFSSSQRTHEEVKSDRIIFLHILSTTDEMAKTDVRNYLEKHHLINPNDNVRKYTEPDLVAIARQWKSELSSSKERVALKMNHLKKIIELDKKISIEEYLIFTLYKEIIFHKKNNLILKKIKNCTHEVDILTKFLQNKPTSLETLSFAMESLRGVTIQDLRELVKIISIYKNHAHYSLVLHCLGLPSDA